MNVKTIRKIFLVHGEEKAQKHLKEYLYENTKIPVQIIKLREKYQL